MDVSGQIATHLRLLHHRAAETDANGQTAIPRLLRHRQAAETDANGLIATRLLLRPLSLNPLVLTETPGQIARHTKMMGTIILHQQYLSTHKQYEIL